MTSTGRRPTLVAGALFGSLLLSSCVIGGGSTPKASDASGGEVSGTITFQTWNLKNDKFTSYFNDLIASFEKANPGTDVKWVDQPAEGYQDKLSADAAAGSLPDVVDMGPEAAYTLAQAGTVLDLGKADPEAKGKYLDKAWEAMTFDGLGGGTYGYPWYLNTGPSFFNKALLEKCGLSAAKLPTTYDELFDQAETMAGKCSDDEMIARMPAIETFGEYGVELMDKDGKKFTYNNAKGVELVERFKDLYAKKGFTEEALNNLQTKEVEEFKAGRLAYLPGSSYTLTDLKDTAPKVYKNLAIGPRINNGSPNMYIESLVVNARSEHQALAVAFAKYVTDSAHQLAFAKKASVFPSSAGTLDDPYFTKDDGDPATKVRIESTAQVKKAVVWWPPAFSGSADSETLREQIAQALLGKKSVKAALDASVKYSNERLEANG
ncbi:ABC transporter substrate-binding protein [Streptomyces sp. NPDC051677]|uniref:ABC transporter substrate-binding protein n=1 Tax=Streptomyces sp. NPDC051677 TaxID=3365669 RepID=UPI0037D91CFA